MDGYDNGTVGGDCLPSFDHLLCRTLPKSAIQIVLGHALRF